ncbi:MAG: S53 family peptidase [Solirubrobacteraceae bacterium]
MSRRIGLGTVVSLVMIAAGLIPAVAEGQVAGTQAWRVTGASDLGATASRPMTITLALAPRHNAALRTFVAGPHAPLSSAQFTARYAPAQETVKRVRTWARGHGLTVASVSANRLLVRLAGSSRAIAAALHTGFHSFITPSTGRFTQITRAARLPAWLAGRVSAVLGLSSLGHVALVPPAQRTAAGLNRVLSSLPSQLPILGAALPSLNYPAQYGPKDFWSMYNAPAAQTGTGQQLAIITEGNVSQPKADLATFESRFGLPAVTWNQINVGAPSSDTSGNDEWDLDSQYSTGFAPGVSQLDVYVGPSLSDQDIATTINRWVTDNASKQGSFSAGECELLAYAAGFTSSLDTILAQADAQGQTMFFSSGDTGSQCPAVVGVNGVPAGLPGVNYPASSPYGIGVGGTSVLSPSGPSEIAWYAGGGGSSLLEPTPAFQSATQIGGAVPLLRRGAPDVSLDADPESGYQVVVAGTLQTIGGTSASAPSWQGIWARAQGAHAGGLGFAGPVIYNTEPAAAFHDITLGSNGFPALPGWDYATGRGTPDITQFVNGS